MSVECVTIRGADGKAEARILVGFGFNCFQFRVTDSRGGVDVLWSEPGFETGSKRASGSGIPLLFPFPGRIPGVELKWGERSYSLEAGDGRGNAIHGFVHDRPWRVVEQTEASVTGEFQASRDDRQLLNRWPSDFLIRVKYELTGSTLASEIQIENPGDNDLPYGIGTHPYFRLPLGEGTPEQRSVRLPVTEEWELKDMLVSGRRRELPDAPRYQAGLPFSEMSFDNVFTGLLTDETGRVPARIDDSGNDRAVVLQFDTFFRECVVYNPPHREAICIEPYSCAPGAVALPAELDTGLQQLRPGETRGARFEITLQS